MLLTILVSISFGAASAEMEMAGGSSANQQHEQEDFRQFKERALMMIDGYMAHQDHLLKDLSKFTQKAYWIRLHTSLYRADSLKSLDKDSLYFSESLFASLLDLPEHNVTIPMLDKNKALQLAREEVQEENFLSFDQMTKIITENQDCLHDPSTVFDLKAHIELMQLLGYKGVIILPKDDIRSMVQNTNLERMPPTPIDPNNLSAYSEQLEGFRSEFFKQNVETKLDQHSIGKKAQSKFNGYHRFRTKIAYAKNIFSYFAELGLIISDQKMLGFFGDAIDLEVYESYRDIMSGKKKKKFRKKKKKQNRENAPEDPTQIEETQETTPVPATEEVEETSTSRTHTKEERDAAREAKKLRKEQRRLELVLAEGYNTDAGYGTETDDEDAEDRITRKELLRIAKGLEQEQFDQCVQEIVAMCTGTQTFYTHEMKAKLQTLGGDIDQKTGSAHMKLIVPNRKREGKLASMPTGLPHGGSPWKIEHKLTLLGFLWRAGYFNAEG